MKHRSRGSGDLRGDHNGNNDHDSTTARWAGRNMPNSRRSPRTGTKKDHHHARFRFPEAAGLLFVLSAFVSVWHLLRRAMTGGGLDDDDYYRDGMSGPARAAARLRKNLAMRKRLKDDAPPYHPRQGTNKENEEMGLLLEAESLDLASADSYNTRRMELKFQSLLQRQREREPRAVSKEGMKTVLDVWLKSLDRDIRRNVATGTRWILPHLLPPLPGSAPKQQRQQQQQQQQPQEVEESGSRQPQRFFHVERSSQKPMTWEAEWEELKRDRGGSESIVKPAVDYTDQDRYRYPPPMLEPPSAGEGQYPRLTPLEDLLRDWPQDEDRSGTITETLVHFNYTDPAQLEAARRFRDEELPFKVTGVPEVVAAGAKWTDEYLSAHFSRDGRGGGETSFLSALGIGGGPGAAVPPAAGQAQESADHFFAFFVPAHWRVDRHGLPPTRFNDWTFAKWAEHSRYADAVRLEPDRPHFYWQAGVDKRERHLNRDQWSFISRDLPSFGSPHETFFVFHPEQQKGIQCRFGERGVVAATHYDGGRNMVAMVTGAKRYILSPPRECSKLGIFTDRNSPIYRHSLLDFGHIRHIRTSDGASAPADGGHAAVGMSNEERDWLTRASKAASIETVLKAGEVLYIPSHWFHYIVSLQKSAQCNVRSGIDVEGTVEFGGRADVENCAAENDDGSNNGVARG